MSLGDYYSANHKTNVVGEADYKLQNRGEMQMSVQFVKPRLSTGNVLWRDKGG